MSVRDAWIYRCDCCQKEETMTRKNVLPEKWARCTRSMGWYNANDGHRTDIENVYEEAHFCGKKKCQKYSIDWMSMGTPDRRVW